MADIQAALQPILNGSAPAPKETTPTNTDDIGQEVLDSLEDDLGDDTAEIVAAEEAGKITPKEAAVLKKKLKLKVDGVESEEEIDFNDEESLRKHLQKSKAFDKRMQEFSGYKSQMDQILEMLDKDPEALLEKMGKNVDELAEKRLTRRVEELKKSPEQLDREKMEKELKDLKEERKKIQEEKDLAEMETMRNQHASEIERDIKAALDDAQTVLPKRDKIVLSRIGQAMFLAMKNGFPEVKAKDVIPFVEKQYKQELSEFFSALPEDTIEAIIGKEPLNRWRKSLISKSKAAAVPAKTKIEDSGTHRETEEESKSKKLNYRDFFKMNG